ncbi:MAG: hypothetical protein K2K46_00225, partial [Lachnospiraceae bacterium]|nr:hypothetical protein [Lachnospiraceae bacterium]
MKRKVVGSIKIIIFLLGFGIIFTSLQSVLHYRWDSRLYDTNIYMKELPEDYYDVFFIGTSELKTAVYPGAIFQTNGITSYNYAVTNKSALTMYYQVKYILRYKKPKIICCDFSALYDDTLPSERETVYRKVVDTMPDFDLKWDMIKSIHEMDSEQSVLSYLFPMLRYHSLWSELTEEHFREDYVYQDMTEDYSNGCSLLNAEHKGEVFDITPEIWSAEKSDEQISAQNAEWYDKMISLCHENDIKIIALFPPHLGDGKNKTARWETTTAYLESRGVEIIDYNNFDAAERIGLNVAEDYMDGGHMTYKGSLKVSRDLAYILYGWYGMEDQSNTEK